MKQNLTCIICPRGCEITVEKENNKISVTGNSCKMGENYAIKECTNPVRTITSTVRVENRNNVTVSVKTEKPIPKDKIFDVMKIIRNEKTVAPLKIGDIIIKDVFGTNIVATNNID